MADSIRKKILGAIKTGMQEITTINGYNTNIGQSVLKSRVIGFSFDDLPGCSVALGIDYPSDDGQSYNRDSISTPVNIIAGVAISPDTDRATNTEFVADSQEDILADIRKAFGEINFKNTYGIKLMKSEYNGGVDIPQETMDNATSVIVGVQFVLTYDTIKNDPYTQP